MYNGPHWIYMGCVFGRSCYIISNILAASINQIRMNAFHNQHNYPHSTSGFKSLESVCNWNMSVCCRPTLKKPLCENMHVVDVFVI